MSTQLQCKVAKLVYHNKPCKTKHIKNKPVNIIDPAVSSGSIVRHPPSDAKHINDPAEE